MEEKTIIRKSFKFHKWWYFNYIQKLKGDKGGLVLHALMEYGHYGKETVFADKRCAFVYRKIKAEIDKQPKD